MKTYSVALCATIVVDAESENDAIQEAYYQLRANQKTADSFLDRLEVEEDGVDEIHDTPCIYEHDHSKGGCEYHD